MIVSSLVNMSLGLNIVRGDRARQTGRRAGGQAGRQGYVSPLSLIFANKLGKVCTDMATHHRAV